MAQIASRAQPTVEEILALLKKTALPTVVCEGSDDLIVYRRIEDRLTHMGVSVLPAGGRQNVLEIFRRRTELPKNIKLAFVADQDTWINVGVPSAYCASEMCLTDGYSIENDVVRDGELESLLSGSEVATFRAELHSFMDWYALALSRHLANASAPIALHPDQVLNPSLRTSLLALAPGETYPTAFRTALFANYKQVVRGKSLLALIVRSANSRTGQPRHSCTALLEMVAARPGPLVERITKAVATALT